MNPRREWRNEQGMALLMVLLIIASMSVCVSLTQTHWFSFFQRTVSFQSASEVRQQLAGAESVLVSRYRRVLANPVLQPSYPWLTRWHSMELDGQHGQFLVRDLQACFNLNAILAQGAGAGAETVPQQLLRHLLVATGSDSNTARQVVASLVAQKQQEGKGFADVSELRLSMLLPASQVTRLRSQLCVLPVMDLKINLNGLTQRHEPLLAALLSAADEPLSASALLALRPQAGWQSIDQFMASLEDDALRQQLENLSPFLSTGSDFYEFTLRMDSQPFAQLRSQVRNQGRSFTVFRRLYGPEEG